jgi:aromatic-L-amino-acid/L-tryptophan decarboxylase
MIGGINCQIVKSTDKLEFSAENLEAQIKNDIKAGLVPCYVCGTIGTTRYVPAVVNIIFFVLKKLSFLQKNNNKNNLCISSSMAMDPIDKLGAIAKKYNMWLHVDAAAAGSCLLCPEYRSVMKGIELTHSFNFNPHKQMLTNFDFR